MRLLLDTHIALWAIMTDPKLPPTAREAIETGAETVVVSAVSVWEIAIKYARNRGRPNDMPMPGARALEEFEAAGFELLPILPAHAAAVDALPPLHKDPFDRLLVAQAITEPLRLLTSDKRLAAYGAIVTTV